jgi:pyridoxal phosphate enzyme (YggS family)
MINSNLALIHKNIKQTAEQCNRNPEDICLVAVSKRMPLDSIIEANKNGQVHFGENYIQEAHEKIDKINAPLQWHFIGHLQSNKTKIAAQLFQVIETVDRFKIAKLLDRHAGNMNKKLDILVQVNIAKEEQKSGIAPENTHELLTKLTLLNNLRVRGLMIIPPFVNSPDENRRWFKELKQLSVLLAKEELFYDNETVELSMGMSGDYMVAIEEGATLIRVGTALFGSRPS